MVHLYKCRCCHILVPSDTAIVANMAQCRQYFLVEFSLLKLYLCATWNILTSTSSPFLYDMNAARETLFWPHLYWSWWPGDTGKKYAGGASRLCGSANHEAHQQWRHLVPGEELCLGRSNRPRWSRSSPSEPKQYRALFTTVSTFIYKHTDCPVAFSHHYV